MNLRNYLFLSSKSFFKKKINLLNISLLVLIMVMIIFVSSFSKTFSNLINNQIQGNIHHHVLLLENIRSNSSNVDISNIENIEYTAPQTTYSHYVVTNNNEGINLIGVPDYYLKKISNDKVDVKVNDILICPSQFYLGENPEYYNKEFLRNLHDGHRLLNKTLDIESTNYKKKYTIKGIYDVNKYMYGEYNTCFTKQENIEEIYKKEIEAYMAECDSETMSCDYSQLPQTIVMVKNVDKINETQKALQNSGYTVSKISEIDTSGINFITNILLTIVCIIVFISFIILLTSNSKFINYNKKNNLIYKALGYDNSILIKINYLESIILSIISFIVAITISIFIYHLLSKILIVDIKTGCPIQVSYISIIYGLIIVLITPLLSVYISLKNNNNSIIKDFSDDEI